MGKTKPIKQVDMDQEFLKTPWTDVVDENNPLPEYPRPQMRRERWLNLNGMWEYKIEEKEMETLMEFDGPILVPFCVESYLSRVGQMLNPEETLWYHKTFIIPEEWEGSDILLHFGASDWETKVYVNNFEAGIHRGGYLPFSFNITEYVKSGEVDLLVSVRDSTNSENHQYGKQSLNPGGIFYTPCSGIWQTVWLEPVPKNGIKSLKINPDIDNISVRIQIELFNADKKGLQIGIDSKAGGLGYSAEFSDSPVTLKLTNLHLWTLDDPFLYDLTVNLSKNGTLVDSVNSYFAMRKFSTGKDEKGITRLLLNNKPIFQLGPLDQGYWPDGNYTAPTDEALRFDIEFAKKLGFNMIRKHVKVEPARWYYHCDKLGMIVWQDMVSGGKTGFNRRQLMKVILRGYYKGKDTTPKQYKRTGRDDPEIREEFEAELKEMIDYLYNFPCIGVWVIFNEGWGQYDSDRIAKWVKQYDPSRLIDATSGFDLTETGDIRSWHIYIRKLSFFENPNKFPDYAIAISECGGYKLTVPDHVWNEGISFGYGGVKDRDKLTVKYAKLMIKQALPMVTKGLSALIYTQISDVETELNGLITYDRKIEKLDVDTTRKANLKLIQTLEEQED